MNCTKIKEVFDNYVSNFNLEEEKIQLKYYHTFEVADNCREIAKRLKLESSDQDLAYLIGICHDIGRFKQVKEFNTFKDNEMDHADYGVKVLFEDGLIRKFITDPSYDEIIKKAVRNHNKFAIVDEVNDRERLFCNIIRDADKIDIFRVKRVYFNNEIEDIPSKKVIADFEKHKPILLKDVKNKSDAVICNMGFIFDFNFKESLQLLKELGNYSEFVNCIKVSDENKDIFNKLKKETYMALNEGCVKCVRKKI